MASHAEVRAVQPIPYFSNLRPLPDWARTASRSIDALEVRHAPMPYVPGILKSLDSFWLERSLRAPVASLHAEKALDVIDAHFGYPEGVGCVRLAQRLGVPAFITIRGFESEFVHKRIVGKQIVHALRNAAGCICVSHSLREFAMDHGVPPERLRVIHNSIDSATFRWRDKAEGRARLNLPAATPLVVSVGHLLEVKRHHVLLEAFAELRRSNDQVILAIVGGQAHEQRYPQFLKDRARELGVAQATRFLGSRPPAEVASWLQAADAFALASAREGCCNAVIEALAVGTPVVATEAGDNAYFVKDGMNGYLVPVDDPPALAAALKRALTRANWDRQRISRDIVASVGSWDSAGQRVLNFMEERLESTLRPRVAMV